MNMRWYEWLFCIFIMACAYITAFTIWFFVGLLILPVGCLILKENLYEGWTSWCFGLHYLDE